MRKVINFHVKDHALAEDIFQDFFFSFMSKPVPKDINNVKMYLFRAITNDIIDAKRRIERYRTHLNRYAELENSVCEKNNPENTAIRIEEIQKMFESIEKHINRCEAHAITLRYRNGYSINEVAGRMRIKPRSVSRYLSIGINKIRQVILHREKSDGVS